MRLTPPADRVLIRRCEPEAETAFGLVIIPSNAPAQSERGVVVAVGDGAYDRNGVQHPLGVQIGDEVVIPRYGGTEIEAEDGETVISILASEILAVVA